MAELITTEEERAAASYLQWDDAALGRFTKQVGLMLEEHASDADGLHRVASVSGAILLIASCIDSNADTLNLKFDGYTHGDVECGDWEIVVRKVAGEAEGA